MEYEEDFTNSSELLMNDTDIPVSVRNLTDEGFCSPWSREVETLYGAVHGYTSLGVCTLGSLLNIFNLIVLTRKEMHNPTNTILTGLAFADLLNDLEYIPFALLLKILAKPDFPPKTLPWATYVLVHSNFSQLCHTVSIFLTLTLAVWRYIMVAMPLKNKTLCTMQRAKLAVILSYICSLLACIPVFLTFSIKDTSGMANITEVKYYVHYSALASAHDHLLAKANFWTYGVVIKLIPCIVLTVVSFRLINSLMEAKRRKAQLKGRKGAGEEAGGGGDRTTRMLLAVLLLFLMTEFPQGILGLMTLVLGDSFFKSCYLPLGDLMDIAALSNSAMNFVLYTCMSLKFRQVFIKTFGLSNLCTKQLSQQAELSVAPRTTRPSVAVISNGNGSRLPCNE